MNKDSIVKPDRKGILVLGAGGVGCPALRRLAEAGISPIGIADPDRVERSNLPRQTLYSEKDIDRPKIEAAAESLRSMPGGTVIEVRTHACAVRGDEEFLEGYGVIVEAVDGQEQKMQIHDRIVRRRILLVHVGALGWEVQILSITGRGCLRCFFGMEAASEAPDCRRAGVVGPVAGLAGVAAAAEALRMLRGAEPHFSRRLWSFDARRMRARTIEFAARADCPVCGVAL